MAYLPFPPGTILPFAGTTAPDGWLLCDGSPVSQTTYAALFSVISTTYDTQTNPTTNSAYLSPGGGNFRIPDYRASFLRGTGTPFAGDAVTLGGWQVQKTAKNGLTASLSGNATSSSVTGSTVANTTGGMNANVSHDHGVKNSGGGDNNSMWHRLLDNMYSASGDSAWDVTSYSPYGTLSTNTEHGHSIPSLTLSGTAAGQALSSGTVTVGAGDNETRPHNKGVNYIIKF